MLSQAQSPAAAILASTVWGLGVCVMWPTMLASVAERYPRGGSWAMGLVGSAGALASFFVLPQLGAMYEAAKVEFAGGPEAFAALTGPAKLARSEERRGGKECVSTCRSRGSPDH